MAARVRPQGASLQPPFGAPCCMLPNSTCVRAPLGCSLATGPALSCEHYGGPYPPIHFACTAALGRHAGAAAAAPVEVS